MELIVFSTVIIVVLIIINSIIRLVKIEQNRIIMEKHKHLKDLWELEDDLVAKKKLKDKYKKYCKNNNLKE